MEPMRLLVTDAAAQPPRQATAWLIMTLGRKTMVSLTDNTNRPIENLPELLRCYQSGGGMIVSYQRVGSAIFFSQKTTHFVWVSPREGRIAKSLPYTIFTLIFGWWSLHGLVWTLQALTHNFRGGDDVTEAILESTRGIELHEIEAQVAAEKKAERKKNLVVVSIVIVAVTVITYFAVYGQ
jgi:hypothetical protein